MGTITLRWLEKQLFVGSDSNNHSIVIGRNKDEANPWLGMKPSELLLISAASCSSWDIVEILTKQREPLQDLKVTCKGEQMAEIPYSFTNIHIHYAVTGPVDPERLKKAIRLSEDKYCSVISTLRLGTTVTSDFEIVSNEIVQDKDAS